MSVVREGPQAVDFDLPRPNIRPSLRAPIVLTEGLVIILLGLVGPRNPAFVGLGLGFIATGALIALAERRAATDGSIQGIQRSRRRTVWIVALALALAPATVVAVRSWEPAARVSHDDLSSRFGARVSLDPAFGPAKVIPPLPDDPAGA